MLERKLSGDWYLDVIRNHQTPAEAGELPENIPITVPGDIASALLSAGLIPDPYIGRNELDCLWIGRTDWKLRTTFHLNPEDLENPGTDSIPAGAAAGRIVLDQVDTVAEYRLNGEKLAESRNMFRPVYLDISGLLKRGANSFEVIIRSPENFCDKAAARLPYPVPHTAQFPWQWNHRNLLRKVACHGGWDWGPTLMTGGIYSTPLLQIGGSGHLVYWTIRQSRQENSLYWKLESNIDFWSQSKRDIDLHLTVPGIESSHPMSRRVTVNTGFNEICVEIEIRDPELWWPAGQGEQSLYDVTLDIDGEVRHKRIGFRKIDVIVRDDEVGRSMTFRVNGRDIFAKGANWIPVDAFPARHSEEVYRRLLADAVEANMNMIRLWGGGQYEKDIFYELCDELGLMIWHDMMFSCALYPANQDFLADVEKEIRHQVKRLKDHPSIVLWCGNNEDLGALTWFPESRQNRDRYLVDYDRLNEGVVGRVIRAEDPDRTWWPSSPSAGEGDYSDCWHDDSKGDMHYWSVWHEGLPFEAYYDVIPRFCSEFGFQSFPSLSGVADYAEQKDWNLTSPVMRHHQKNNAGNSIILETMARYFRWGSDFPDFLWLSQVQQAWAIKTAVEYWRAQRPISMGALYWQLNDLWPVASWSSIEYSGKWKLLHYEAKRFFAPLHLALYRKDGRIFLSGLNDTNDTVDGSVSVTTMSFDGEIIDRRDLGVLSCRGQWAQEFYSEAMETHAGGYRDFSDGPQPHDTDKSDVVAEGFTDRFITAEWHLNEKSGKPGRVLRSSLFLTEPRDCELADPRIIVRDTEEPGTLVLESHKPAFFVSLEPRVPGRFDDAGLTLYPDTPVRLHFHPEKGVPMPANLSEGLRIRHLKSVY